MGKSLLFILIVAGMVWSCDKTSLKPSDSETNSPEEQNIVSNNITTGSFTDLYTGTVGLDGATVKISKPNTPVDGMEIVIPTNSFSTTQSLSVSYAEIKNHQFGTNFHPISPIISISCEGGYSNDLMRVTIPVKIPQGNIPLGFYYDEATGRLEGIPFESITATSITLLTRHFLPGSNLKSGEFNFKSTLPQGAKMIISSISESLLNGQQIISSGFKPGRDDWEFVNYGSYLNTGGHCSGQNIAAMWYYYEKKTALGSLFNKFSDNSNLWQDNAKGYRFCSVIHKDLIWNGMIATISEKYIDKNQLLDKLKLLTIAGTMLVTGEPQGIGIYRLFGLDQHGLPTYEGHDLICYQVSVSDGKLYISDPNLPDIEQYINFKDNKFDPYIAKKNGNATSHPYNFVNYYAKSAYIEWNKIGKRFEELVNNTIGTVAPNIFPAYTIWNKSGAGSELQDGTTVTKDTLHTIIISPTIGLHYLVSGQKLTGCYVYNQNGARIDRQEGVSDAKTSLKSGLYVILKPGINKLGYYIVGWDSKALDNNGKYLDNFIDFKWMTINYLYLKISADQTKGETNKEVKFIARTNGTAPKSAKYVWNFGDGTSSYTKITDSTAVHTFVNEGTFNIKVELFDNSTNSKTTETSINYEVIEVTVPVLSTTTASSITSTTATSGGIVSSNGGAVVTARGVCWSTNSNPTIIDNKSSDGTGSGTFSSFLIGLTANTTYYVRAYATNSIGTAYGNQISFRTAVNSPTIITTAATSITSTTANSGGNITSDGGGAISQRGVCWGTTSNPTTANNKTSNGSGTGIFTSSLTSLSAGVTYFVRAYAINNSGTYYGNELTFRTSVTIPSVTTTIASSVTANSATCGGNVTSNGGATVTARGVCWSTNTNPTTANNKSSDGTGSGTFSSSITGLSANKTYYVRAYATNSAGTAYGNQITFVSNNLNLDGNWASGGTGITISGTTGIFYSFSSNWQSVANCGLIALGAAKIKNISKTSSTTWNCLELWWHAPANNLPDYVFWSNSSTITMSNDGQSIVIASNVTYEGINTSGSATYYRQP
jgi:hypothetical protein